jgi:hypothetical protein
MAAERTEPTSATAALSLKRKAVPAAGKKKPVSASTVLSHSVIYVVATPQNFAV